MVESPNRSIRCPNIETIFLIRYDVVKMARYRYHGDWRVSYQYDCNFSVQCHSLKDALWIAALRGDQSLISVHADCERDGIKKTAHVGITLRESRGLTMEQIFDALDREVDEFIACRVRVGTWGNSDRPT
jgi:hypothetical protein